MAKTKISEFSPTPANNTDIDNINIAEGCAPSGINDAIRELMAQLKDFQAGTAGDSFNGPIGTSTAAAGAFTTLSSTGATTLGDAAGDAITVNGATTFANVNPTLTAGTANGVAYLNGSKVLTTGSALTFDGSEVFKNSGGTIQYNDIRGSAAAGTRLSAGGTLGTDSFDLFQNSSAGYVFNRANTPIIFGVNGSEQMRLTSTGLGIGTSSPDQKLVVQGSNVSMKVADGTYSSFVATISSANAYGNGSTVGQLYLRGQAGIGFSGNSGGATQMVLDSSGNLGLGVTPSAWLPSYKAFQLTGGSIQGGTTGLLELYANSFRNSDGNFIYIASQGASRYAASDAHRWYTAPSGTAGNAISFTQAMTLDASGNLLVGTTSAGSDRVRFSSPGASTNQLGLVSSDNVGGNGYIQFRNSALTSIGSITRVGTTAAVAYNTSSDYRLKNTVAPMTGALAKVALLKPCTYKWNADGSEGEGFIAHELAEVVPQCVTGEKDAVDAEGNPKYQGIDTSFLVATLTAAIQEQQALINELKARLDAANL
jgi:hypothetical protein